MLEFEVSILAEMKASFSWRDLVLELESMRILDSVEGWCCESSCR